MVAASLNTWRNAPLTNHVDLRKVDKLIDDNHRFINTNFEKLVSHDRFQSAANSVKKHSRSWLVSALLATATYFIGRTLLNALLPKPEENADFEKPEPIGTSNSAKFLLIGALTGVFKWFSR